MHNLPEVPVSAPCTGTYKVNSFSFFFSLYIHLNDCDQGNIFDAQNTYYESQINFFLSYNNRCTFNRQYRQVATI